MIFVVVLLVLFSLTAAKITVKTGSWGTNLLMGKEYDIQWTSDLPASATVEISIYRSDFFFDDRILTVTTKAPNTGSYKWGSPRTLPEKLDENKDYYIFIKADGGKGQSEKFKISIADGRLSLDWTAEFSVGARKVKVTDPYTAFHANTKMNLAWKTVDVDPSLTMSVKLGRCPKCDCERSSNDGALVKCPGALSFIDKFLLPKNCLTETTLVETTPTRDGQKVVDIPTGLDVGACYFFFAQSLERKEYTARSHVFKFTTNAISLVDPVIPDWPAGETRTIKWRVISNSISPNDLLRIYVKYDQGLFYREDQLASSDLLKVSTGSALFTLPSNIDLKDKGVYLRVQIERGNDKGDFVLSQTFAILAPAQITPTVRLFGDTLNPRRWSALEQRRIFFTTAAYDTVEPLPNGEIMLIDDNPYSTPWTDSVGSVAMDPAGGLSYIPPITAPTSASMRIFIKEATQSVDVHSNHFMLEGVSRCVSAGSADSLSCTHFAGGPVLYATERYSVAVNSLTAKVVPACGGAFSLEISTMYSIEGASTMTATATTQPLVTSAVTRQILVDAVDLDIVVELSISNINYDRESGLATFTMRLSEKSGKNNALLAAQASATGDVSKLMCDDMRSGEQGTPTQPPPSNPDFLKEFLPKDPPACAADDSQCSVLCAPFYMKNCECDSSNQISALCTERDSALLTAKCVGIAELTSRCEVVCGHRAVTHCACNKDGGTTVTCDRMQCPAEAVMKADCDKACGSFGVDKCACDQFGRIQLQCAGQMVFEAPTPAPSIYATTAASQCSLAWGAMAVVVPVLIGMM